MTGETILSRSNDRVPVETRLQIVLGVMSGEITTQLGWTLGVCR